MFFPPDDVRRYFSDLACVYAEHRPGYPREAVEAALGGLPAPVRALDVGCGTGILSRLLAAAGAEVTALDPNAEMLAEARRHPGVPAHAVRYVEGRAERLPLPDRSLALVTCAQAFHWFDPTRALAEFRRVLERGGRLALLWNVREVADPFTGDYEHVVGRAQADAAARGLTVHRVRSFRPDRTGDFAGVRLLTFANPQRLDWPALLGRARSASYFPTQDPLRRELEMTLRQSFETYARNGIVTLAQRTELTLANAVHSPP